MIYTLPPDIKFQEIPNGLDVAEVDATGEWVKLKSKHYLPVKVRGKFSREGGCFLWLRMAMFMVVPINQP